MTFSLFSPHCLHMFGMITSQRTFEEKNHLFFQFHLRIERIMKFLILFAIFSATSAINFDCKFVKISSELHCRIDSYTEEENQVLTAVNGSAKAYPKVKGILFDLRGKNLDYFPKGIEKFFPNLLDISISYGNIKKLNGDEFEHWKDLEEFRFDHTNLEIVPGNLFSKNKKLENIILSNNKIKVIGAELLDGLDELSVVSFLGNVCIDQSGLIAEEYELIKKIIREKCQPPLETTPAPTTTSAPQATSDTTRITLSSVFLILMTNLFM